MPVESGTTIVDLDSLWPLSGDPLLEGDDHLRLLKAVLKTQFPGAGGLGFATPITATEAEINYLSGLTSNVQDQLDAITADDALIAPSGTVMIFRQAAPPVGWTQNTSNDNTMLRNVGTAGGGAGGTDSPISFDISHTHTTGNHTLTVSQLPSADPFTLNFTNNGGGNTQPGTANPIAGDAGTPTASSNNINWSGGGQAHNHGTTGSSGPTFTPKYVDVITAVKD